MGSYQSNTSKEIGPSSTWVEFKDDWFAQGASKRVYRGTYRGNPEKEGKQCVVKVYKEEWYENIKEYAWTVDDRAYHKAHEMAQLFNTRTAMFPAIIKHTEFVKPEFTRVDTRASFWLLGFLPISSFKNAIPSNASVLVERYLEGDYIKFTSNSGFVDPAEGALPEAFSHFTYHASEGQIMVSDLQGVMDGTQYTFTDPAVLSGGTQLGVYGPSDLGKFGIVKFFKSHMCNDLCKGLNKPHIFNVTTSQRVVMDKIVENISGERSSTFTYQLSKSSGVSESEVQKLQHKIELETIPEERSGSDSDVETHYQSSPQRIGWVCPTMYKSESAILDTINTISNSMLDVSSSKYIHIHPLSISSDSDSDSIPDSINISFHDGHFN